MGWQVGWGKGLMESPRWANIISLAEDSDTVHAFACSWVRGRINNKTVDSASISFWGKVGPPAFIPKPNNSVTLGMSLVPQC